MFFVLYITKSSARTGIAARRDEILFFLMGRLCNRSLQFRQQRRSAPQLSGESFNCAQGGGANVMLHSLYIMIDDAIVEARSTPKCIQRLLQLANFMSQALPAAIPTKSQELSCFKKASDY